MYKQLTPLLYMLKMKKPNTLKKNTHLCHIDIDWYDFCDIYSIVKWVGIQIQISIVLFLIFGNQFVSVFAFRERCIPLSIYIKRIWWNVMPLKNIGSSSWHDSFQNFPIKILESINVGKHPFPT